ncbi:MAG: hypothetical protein ABEI52_10510 [Halobacteriaceae archaeon]
MQSRRKFLITTGVTAATALAGCTGGNQGATPTDTTTTTTSTTTTTTTTSKPDVTVGEAKQTLSKYKDLKTALQDGYRSTHEFISSPKGGMGIHFVNPKLMKQKPDPTQPPILMYNLSKTGQYSLMGAEWFVPAKAVETTPTLFGQKFDGPMPGHSPNQPKHYDLHAWLFKDNPNGTFAAFNPEVEPPKFMDTVAKTREAVKEYKDVAKAKEAGYKQEGKCVQTPKGGMGIHYINHDVKGINPEKPPILMYEPTERGKQLIGVEWFVPADKVNSAPTLFSQEFKGPMPGHTKNQPKHYELHAWFFQANPNGMFANFNPVVTC